MSPELPVAAVCHAMPGRTRLRLVDHRGDAAFFASLASCVSALPGVLAVKTSPLTGSVLVRHFGSLTNLRSAAIDAGLFVVGEVEREPEASSSVEIDPKILAAFALGGLALWQMSREKIFPPALTLLWYASNLGGTWGKGAPWEGR